MYPNKGELKYNKTWAWLQFNIYQMSFETMKLIVNDIKDDNKSDLLGKEVSESTIYFEPNLDIGENRRKGCIRARIQLTIEHYSYLKEVFPNLEIK